MRERERERERGRERKNTTQVEGNKGVNKHNKREEEILYKDGIDKQDQSLHTRRGNRREHKRRGNTRYNENKIKTYWR